MALTVTNFGPVFFLSYSWWRLLQVFQKTSSFLALVLTPTSSNLPLLFLTFQTFTSSSCLFCLTISLWQSIYSNAAPPKCTECLSTRPIILCKALTILNIGGYLTQLRKLTGFLKHWPLCVCRLNPRIHFLSHAQWGFRATSAQLYSDFTTVSLLWVF